MPASSRTLTFVKDSPFRGRAALPIWHEGWMSLASFVESMKASVIDERCDRSTHCGLTLWPIAQTKPESSRASATTILL